MKTTFTNLDITNIMNYANNENSIIRNGKFTMEFAWKLKKNIKKIADAHDTFTKFRDEIMNSYSTDEYSNENENGRFVKEEYLEEYYGKLNELLIQTTDIDIDKANLEKIAVDMSKFEISVPELELLSFMIEDDKDEVEKVQGTVE